MKDTTITITTITITKEQRQELVDYAFSCFPNLSNIKWKFVIKMMLDKCMKYDKLIKFNKELDNHTTNN